MENLNQPIELGGLPDDIHRAVVQLSRAIPRCIDDPEIVDALAYVIALFGYSLAQDAQDTSITDPFGVEVVRTTGTLNKKTRM